MFVEFFAYKQIMVFVTNVTVAKCAFSFVQVYSCPAASGSLWFLVRNARKRLARFSGNSLK